MKEKLVQAAAKGPKATDVQYVCAEKVWAMFGV